jgi:DNA repair protein RadC
VVRHNALAVVAVHHHPSADVALTAELARAGQLLDVEVLDHLIIGQGRWTSLRRAKPVVFTSFLSEVLETIAEE